MRTFFIQVGGEKMAFVQNHDSHCILLIHKIQERIESENGSIHTVFTPIYPS